MAVDYVKTGVPARMPRELVPRKWPHFMEKIHKPKEQQYTSHKVLGKLYDQVERVDFVPAFSNPFDKRILWAYTLEDQILQDAAELKREYDAAMRRIMAQHDIKTEFEVWSTFVLHHSNQSKDYKFHEEIGQLSSALKDQYRIECYRKAGSKDFTSMGPFVAAMYKVTSIEMGEAIKECNQFRIVGGQEEREREMTPESMPLMSFPWLFHDILGKIANSNGFLSSGESADAMVYLQRATKHNPPRKFRTDQDMLKEEDILETSDGVTHRGEILELFDRPSHQQEGDSNTTPKSVDAGSSSAKPPQNTPSASADELAGVPANDEDIWSSTESGSGEIIRVYQGSDVLAPHLEPRQDSRLLLDLENPISQPSTNGMESNTTWAGSSDLLGDVKTNEEPENKNGNPNSAAPNLASNAEAMAALIKDVKSDAIASPDPKQHSQSAQLLSSPQAKPSSHHADDLLDLSEEISPPQTEPSSRDMKDLLELSEDASSAQAEPRNPGAEELLDLSEVDGDYGANNAEPVKQAEETAILFRDLDLLEFETLELQKPSPSTHSISPLQNEIPTPDSRDVEDVLDLNEEVKEDKARVAGKAKEGDPVKDTKATVTLIEDVDLLETISLNPQKRFQSTQSVSSPQSERISNRNEDLSGKDIDNGTAEDEDGGAGEDEDNEAEEVIIELDLKPSLLDQLARLNEEW